MVEFSICASQRPMNVAKDMQKRVNTKYTREHGPFMNRLNFTLINLWAIQETNKYTKKHIKIKSYYHLSFLQR